MAEDMTRLLAVCLCALAAGVHAQAVQDPTRPPAQLIKPSAGAALSGAPQLQSILIARGAGGRRVAVIDGAMVRVGDVVRGARVTGMTPSEVQLQRGGKREVLTMRAPEAEPEPVPAAAPAAVLSAAPSAPPGGKPE
jgi:MSHA biogenesis protein MshK